MNNKEFDKIVSEELKSLYVNSFEGTVENVIFYLDQEIDKTFVGIRQLMIISNAIAKEYYPDVDLLSLASKVLLSKSKEYAMNGDRLWNFKPNYKFMNKDPKLNLLGYLTKHVASCMDILTGKIVPNKEMIIEKFGDVVNYCILLIALLKEKEEHDSINCFMKIKKISLEEARKIYKEENE